MGKDSVPTESPRKTRKKSQNQQNQQGTTERRNLVSEITEYFQASAQKANKTKSISKLKTKDNKAKDTSSSNNITNDENRVKEIEQSNPPAIMGEIDEPE